MDHANIFVPLALAGFVVVAFACVAKLGPQRGVLVAMLGGWLFLPEFEAAAVAVPVLHLKSTFVPGVVLAASVLLHTYRWRQLRLHALDLPVLVLCLIPFATSLSNGLGAYDGASATFERLLSWGVPYVLGRLYFGEAGALKELAKGLIVAGLLYVPLCLWEVRMSPQLHRTVYGFSPVTWVQVLRFSGYRPSAFMTHGLMLGMFMATATLTAFWMWRTGALPTILRTRMSFVCALLAFTTVLCKSTGAILLLLVGVGVLECTRRMRTPVAIIVLLAIPTAYCAARIGGWSGRDLVTMSQGMINEDRAQSLQYRIRNEDMLVAKALERPWLGWGRWNRSRVFDDEGNDISVTDGLWIIMLGSTGFVGLVAEVLLFALPALALLRRFPGVVWRDPRLAPAVALTVALLLAAVDQLLNAMMTPLLPVVAGALSAFVLRVGSTRDRTPTRRQRHATLARS